tara:strand:+ start:1055 stop:1318 length:264 start_codon:yes stop_codon:yes gene_type:complete
MSGIYTDFILPLDGTPTAFMHGDHCGISVVKCEYLLNGAVVQPASGLLPEDQFIIPPIGGQTLVQIYNPANSAVEVRYELQITETAL